MIYDHKSDTHGSMDVICLYAMPNLYARFYADRIEATEWDCDYPECAVCGKSVKPFAVHHEPPRSKGSLLLQSEWGQFVVKPALMLLCAECHRDRHDRGELSFSWRWDTPEDEEKWLSGWFYAHGYAEHDSRFFKHGSIVVNSRGMEWEVK